MTTRLGTPATKGSQAAAYGEKISIGDVAVTLFPAGHVLGSAQVLIEWKGARVVVSGDYKRSADPTCPAFELVPCDLFITEATFALPVFQHGDAREEVAKLLRSHAAISRARACGRRLRARQEPAGDRAAARGGLRAADLSARRAGRVLRALRVVRRAPRAAEVGDRRQARRDARRDRAGSPFGDCRPLVAQAARSGDGVRLGMDAGARAGAPAGRRAAAGHLRPCRLGRTDRDHRRDRRRGDLGHAWTRGRAAAPYPDEGRKGRALALVGREDEDQ